MAAKPKPDDKTQFKAFRKAARELGCEDDAERFNAALRKDRQGEAVNGKTRKQALSRGPLDTTPSHCFARGIIAACGTEQNRTHGLGCVSPRSTPLVRIALSNINGLGEVRVLSTAPANHLFFLIHSRAILTRF
jgi:hypothetical protein